MVRATHRGQRVGAVDDLAVGVDVGEDERPFAATGTVAIAVVATATAVTLVFSSRRCAHTLALTTVGCAGLSASACCTYSMLAAGEGATLASHSQMA